MTSFADFREQFNPKVLKVGQRIYKEGQILELKQVDHNYWLAVVQGEEPSHVAVIIGEDGQLAWHCSCGLGANAVCEHVAAVLLVLEAELGSQPVLSEKAKSPAKMEVAKADKLRKAAADLPKEELESLLLELALQDKDVERLLLSHAKVDADDYKSSRRKVKKILGQARDRHGFIDYWGTHQAANELIDLIDQAQDFLDYGSTLKALAIYQAVFEEVVAAVEQADDSSGVLGECISYALDGLLMAADDLPAKKISALFDYCLTHALIEPFVHWDWAWDLLGIAADLYQTAEERERLFSALDQMANLNVDEKWLAEHDWDRAAAIKITILQQEGDIRSVFDFLEQNQDKESMQVGLALLHIQEGNLSTARQICEGWLALPDPQRPYLRPEFLTVLLEIAQIEGDLEQQISLANQLFLETGYYEYFEALKNMIAVNEWPDFRKALLQKAKGQKFRYLDLGSLYIAEEMWDELLEFVQEHPQQVQTYHKYLAKKYPQEISQVYEQLALDTLKTQVNRKGYRKVCGYLRKMQKLGDEERVEQLVSNWREEYSKRPALLDELNRSFGPG